MALQLITGPTGEPVTLAEAKLHLRAGDDTAEDAMITSLITAARQACEERLGRSLLPQTWQLTLDQFPEALELRRGPVRSITSIKFLDPDGVLQTLDPADYQLDTADPWVAYVVPALDTDWPDTQENINAVRVQYVAGYADAASVPGPVKSWILLALGDLYANRERSSAGVEIRVAEFVDRLLDPYTDIAV